MALIGALAGVTNGKSPPPAACEPKTTWPRPAGQTDRDQGARLIETLKEFNADASLAGDPLVGPTFVRYLLEPGRQVPARRIEAQGANLQVRLQLFEEPMISRVGGRIVVDVQRAEREFVSFGELRDRLVAQKNDAVIDPKKKTATTRIYRSQESRRRRQPHSYKHTKYGSPDPS